MERMKRSSKYDELLLELVRDSTIMIDTDGWVIGQINGLAVINMGDYIFGNPQGSRQPPSWARQA